jgi:TolA-binding protein
MEKTVEKVEADDSADLYQIIAWLHHNRKQVITVACGVLAVAAVIGGVFWHKSYVETQANTALGILALPGAAQSGDSSARDFLKIADDFPGTTAASRALLIAGGILFDAGKFDDARAAFEKFMGQYSSSPLANQALLGIASSLEAQGKIQEAASRYEDLRNHYGADSTASQVKSALARCYVALNKPELAKTLYEDLSHSQYSDSWTAEAPSQLQELLVKYPNLAKPAASTNASPFSTLSISKSNAAPPAANSPSTNK